MACSPTTPQLGRRKHVESGVRITLPFGDLIIGACALEIGYAVARNLRDFGRIPGLTVIPI